MLSRNTKLRKNLKIGRRHTTENTKRNNNGKREIFMVSLLFFAKNTYYFMIEKLFKEVFIMKKFLRGILLWGAEIIMLPVTLICWLFVFPIMSVYYRVNGQVDSFKEFWDMVIKYSILLINLKSTIIKYGLMKTYRSFMVE